MRELAGIWVRDRSSREEWNWADNEQRCRYLLSLNRRNSDGKRGFA